MKKHGSTVFLILILLIGLSLMLYPTLSDWWNAYHQNRAIADYDKALTNLDRADYSAYFAEAEDYNRRIREISYPLMYHEKVSGYQEALNLTGNGIMGYVQIPKINVSLPIYHGTDETVLQVAVGHVAGTTLPTGGPSTHCAISAHRGLPSARLFTDLDKMEIGDTFTLTVLDRILTYQVDQILVVEPKEADPLYVVEGEDYCTLVTCTPYGINTHRLLVRGTRIDNIEEKRVIHVTADAIVMDPLIVAPLAAAPGLLLLLAVLLIPKSKNKRRKDV